MDSASTFPSLSPEASSPAARRRPLSRALSLTALTVWSGVLLLAGAYLLAAHVAPMPTPERAALEANVATQRRDGEAGKWLALHALFAECGCSARVAEHLLSRRPMEGVVERVLFVGESPRAAELAAAGYDVELLSEDALRERYGFEAVPAFALVDPTDHVRYLGGYTATKQGADYVDVAATAAARQGHSVSAYPVFGCAVSRSLQRRRDPLGLL